MSSTRASRFLRICLVAFLSLAVTGLGACTRRPAVANAQASVEALARAVLEAIERRDANRLRQLALNEQEFREVVWPELPAARPERNVPFSYAWGDLRVKSEAGLAGILERHGGNSVDLVRVRFAGETTQYQTYVVHRESVLVVRGEDGSREETELRLFGSVFEQNGAFKVFSYLVD